MKNKKRLFLLACCIFVLCVAVYGCSKTVTLGEDFLETKIKSGTKTLEIQKQESPGTGYQWFYVATPDGAVTQTADDFKEPSMTGGYGTRTWKFESATAGDFSLEFYQTPPGTDEHVDITVYNFTANDSGTITFVDAYNVDQSAADLMTE